MIWDRGSDVSRIANRMKSFMTSVGGSDLNLRSIGINQNENGVFEVDIDKLRTALENNPEEVMNLFIGIPSKDTPENENR